MWSENANASYPYHITRELGWSFSNYSIPPLRSSFLLRKNEPDDDSNHGNGAMRIWHFANSFMKWSSFDCESLWQAQLSTQYILIFSISNLMYKHLNLMKRRFHLTHHRYITSYPVILFFFGWSFSWWIHRHCNIEAFVSLAWEWELERLSWGFGMQLDGMGWEMAGHGMIDTFAWMHGELGWDMIR